MTSERVTDLLERGPIAVNLGLREFAETLVAQEAPVVHIDWSPPAELDPGLAALLEELG
jgi:hypothetical protein